MFHNVTVYEKRVETALQVVNLRASDRVVGRSFDFPPFAALFSFLTPSCSLKTGFTSAGEKPANSVNISLKIRKVGNLASGPKVIVIFFEILLYENLIKFFLLSFDAMVALICLTKASGLS